MKPISLASATILALAGSTQAATRVFNWTVSWVTADPSGNHPRKVLGINGQWPLPQVDVDKGDRVVVNLYNDLGNSTTSVHFHGLYQNGTNAMDGAAQINQCPIPPGSNFTYDFVVNQNGTYWYHSHVEGQYPDGYRAPFIVHDKHAYFHDMYDEELTFTLSDWYNEVMDVLNDGFLNRYNPTGAEPVPEYLIFNEAMDVSVPVKPNTTYLLHIMNIGALGNIYFWFEDHNFTIVEIDGVYVEPTNASVLFVTPAQRYTVLLKTKDTTDKNYAIVSVFDIGSFDTPEDCKTLNTTNWLEYNKSAPHKHFDVPYETSDDIVAFDDMSLLPADGFGLYPEPDIEFTLNISMNNLLDGVNYAFFNNITYTAPKVPSLYTILSAPEDLLSDPRIYGEFTHPLVLEHMQTVQIVINNNDPGTHPFHMHGHNFQVVSRSEASDEDTPIPFDPKKDTKFPVVPMRRDTAHVNAMGNLVIRFVADNPGVWIFHCHVEWHLSQGLGVILVEAPHQARKREKVPKEHYDVCIAGNVPYQGNAAANTDDFLNLKGQNAQAPYLPEGFTAKGVFALIVSICSAFVGLYFIGRYGLGDDEEAETKVAERILEDELEAR